jgi:hypothetical protein
VSSYIQMSSNGETMDYLDNEQEKFLKLDGETG